MKTIRVGAAALNQTPLDWDANASTIRQAIQEARENKVSLLCLPELSICGYGCEDAFFSASTRHMSLKVLQEILPETQDIAVTLGLPITHKGALYNACVLVVDCTIVGIVPKQHLAGDGLHYEPRWFKPWPKGEVIQMTLEGITVPFGDLIFDFNGIRVGFEICEDAWVAQRGCHLEPKRKPLRFRETCSTARSDFRSLPCLWRSLCLQQFSRQRSRTRHIRRRYHDCCGRPHHRPRLTLWLSPQYINSCHRGH
jgi:predicted amidohydrolase